MVTSLERSIRSSACSLIKEVPSSLTTRFFVRASHSPSDPMSRRKEEEEKRKLFFYSPTYLGTKGELSGLSKTRP